MKKFRFICVNFNDSNFTKKFCETLRIQTGMDVDFSIHCTIVDNSTNNDDSRLVKEYAEEQSWIEYIPAPSNLGYFGGLNYGLKSSDNLEYDFVAICNNDLTFELDFCEKLASKQYDEKVFSVCPDIITKDGLHQNPHNYSQIGVFRRMQFDLYFLHYYIARAILMILKLARPIKTSPLQPPESCEIHMGVGACYVLTPTFFRRFSKLNYSHFLYAEEAYLTNQIQTAGGILWFDRDLRVNHAESASLSKVPKRTAYEFGRTSYWGCRHFLLTKKSDIK